MNTVVVGILLLTVACVFGEDCAVDNDCKTTSCVDSNNIVVCSDGKCTCVDDVACNPNQDLGRCRNRNDCENRYNAGFITCSCTNAGDLHCIDGQCHCGYPSNPTH